MCSLKYIIRIDTNAFEQKTQTKMLCFDQKIKSFKFKESHNLLTRTFDHNICTLMDILRIDKNAFGQRL